MPGPIPVRQLAVLAALVSTLLAPTGCGSPQPGGQEVLKTLSLAGGSGLSRPEGVGARIWWGTFGGVFLCVDSGEPFNVTGVQYGQQLGSRQPYPLVRSVPPDSSWVGAISQWAPVTARLGKPPRFDTQPDLVGGAIVDVSDEVSYNQACADKDGSYVELLTVMSAGTEGAVVGPLRVSYVLGGEKKSLNIPQEYILCGSMTDQEGC